MQKDFVDIGEKEIIGINTSIQGSRIILNGNLIGSYKSSLPYIDSIDEKIALAVSSTARNHAFKDGNKRTAVTMYYILCRLNNIQAKSNIQDIILEIVNNGLNYKESVKLLFDKKEETMKESYEKTGLRLDDKDALSTAETYRKTDNRKEKLTLLSLHKLRRIRESRKYELLKKYQIMNIIYSKPASEEGGDMGGGF